MAFFSIVIPSFNRARMVKEAVETVLHQSFKDFEIIVVDDGSTDNTKEILQQFGENVRLHQQENAGVASARNRGISLSQGEFICYLDSDDLWHERKLERMAQIIHEFEKPPFIFSNFRKQDISLPRPYEYSNTDIFPFLKQYTENLGGACFRLSGSKKLELLLRGYPLYPSTFVIRRDVHDHFRWDPGILKSEDFNFVLRASKNYDLLYLDEDLTTIRVHTNNKSADFLTKNRTNLYSMKLYRDLYASPEQKLLCNYYIPLRQFLDGRSYLDKGLYYEGLRLILSSLTYPQNLRRLAKKLGHRINGQK